MDPNTIAALTALVGAISTLVVSIATLVKVVTGQRKAATAHRELLNTVTSPRTVETHGDTVVVAPPTVTE